VTRLRADWSAARTSALIAGAASAIGCAAFFSLAPGSWFARIEEMRIVQKPWGEVLIVERRRFWPGDGLLVQWTNAIHHSNPGGDAPWKGEIVCEGEGSWSMTGDPRSTAEMSLHDWVQGDSCPIYTGGAYVAVAEWRFTVLGLAKSTTAVSEPQVVQASGPPP
jgi:hypothetical protein